MSETETGTGIGTEVENAGEAEVGCSSDLDRCRDGATCARKRRGARPGPLIGIIMGSESDRPVMEKACVELDERALLYEVRADLGAPQSEGGRAAHAAECGAAGDPRAGSAVPRHGGRAFPGVVAAYTDLPVIGVPISSGGLGGMDALLAIAQMPPGPCRLHGDRRRAQRRDLRVAHPLAARHARSSPASERLPARPSRPRARSRWRASVPFPSAVMSATSAASHLLTGEERAAYRVPLPRAGKGLEATIEHVAGEVLPRSFSHSHPRSFPFIDGSGLEAGVAAAVLSRRRSTSNLGGRRRLGLGGDR